MGFVRAGSKIKFWTPGFRNNPDIRPPGLLLLASVLFFLSAVAVPVYAVFSSLIGPSGSTFPEGQAIYIAVLHFLLPLGIAFSVSVNSTFSRPLMTVYFALLFTATVAGKGLLGQLQPDTVQRVLVSIAVFASLLGWLYLSPKMRAYYLLLKGKPLPESLATVGAELHGNVFSERTTRTLGWLADHLETIVLLGFIILVFVAFAQTTAYGMPIKI